MNTETANAMLFALANDLAAAARDYLAAAAMLDIARSAVEDADAERTKANATLHKARRALVQYASDGLLERDDIATT